MGKAMVQENNALLVPSTYAWQLARADSRVGDGLCARINYGENNSGDNYHDGEDYAK